MANQPYEWIVSLRTKKTIELTDIDAFAVLFFKAVQNSRRLHLQSLKNDDNSLRASLNILALEEIAKPIILSEILPAFGKKWEIPIESINKAIKDITWHKEKQVKSSNYGRIVDGLDYKFFFSAEEIKNLQKIRESGFYIDPTKEELYSGSLNSKFDVPNDEFTKKIVLFVKERLNSLEMYKSEEGSKTFVRKMSFLKMFDSAKKYRKFLSEGKCIDINNIENLIKHAKEFLENDNDPDMIIYLDREVSPSELVQVVKKHIAEEKLHLLDQMNKTQIKSLKAIDLIMSSRLK